MLVTVVTYRGYKHRSVKVDRSYSFRAVVIKQDLCIPHTRTYVRDKSGRQAVMQVEMGHDSLEIAFISLVGWSTALIVITWPRGHLSSCLEWL